VTASHARKPSPGPSTPAPRSVGRSGDRVLFALCALAGLLVVVTLADIVYQVVNNAQPSISRYRLGFLTNNIWAPNFAKFGAANMIYGTVVSSLFGLVLAGPLGIAIALFLSMMAPPRLRAVIGPLVELLAAVPSIIFGFWGMLILVPFLQTLEPGLHGALGFIPLFGPPQTTGFSLFAAGIVLTLMMLPIISSLCRDLFLTVPQELRDGAEALGATRWEVVRGIVLPSTLPGITAALVLGLGRALGEAIAVSLVIGDFDATNASFFRPAETLGEKIAIQFQSPVSAIHLASLFYCGLILLVIGFLTSTAARLIAGRFDVQRSYARAVAM
jgi:phosphate transport system permease protein